MIRGMALIDATSVILAAVAKTGGKMRENCHICNSNPEDVIFMDLRFTRIEIRELFIHNGFSLFLS